MNSQIDYYGSSAYMQNQNKRYYKESFVKRNGDVLLRKEVVFDSLFRIKTSYQYRYFNSKSDTVTYVVKHSYYYDELLNTVTDSSFTYYFLSQEKHIPIFFGTNNRSRIEYDYNYSLECDDSDRDKNSSFYICKNSLSRKGPNVSFSIFEDDSNLVFDKLIKLYPTRVRLRNINSFENVFSGSFSNFRLKSICVLKKRNNSNLLSYLSYDKELRVYNYKLKSVESRLYFLEGGGFIFQDLYFPKSPYAKELLLTTGIVDFNDFFIEKAKLNINNRDENKLIIRYANSTGKSVVYTLYDRDDLGDFTKLNVDVSYYEEEEYYAKTSTYLLKYNYEF